MEIFLERADNMFWGSARQMGLEIIGSFRLIHSLYILLTITRPDARALPLDSITVDFKLLCPAQS